MNLKCQRSTKKQHKGIYELRPTHQITRSTAEVQIFSAGVGRRGSSHGQPPSHRSAQQTEQTAPRAAHRRLHRRENEAGRHGVQRDQDRLCAIGNTPATVSTKARPELALTCRMADAPALVRSCWKYSWIDQWCERHHCGSARAAFQDLAAQQTRALTAPRPGGLHRRPDEIHEHTQLQWNIGARRVDEPGARVEGGGGHFEVGKEIDQRT